MPSQKGQVDNFTVVLELTMEARMTEFDLKKVVARLRRIREETERTAADLKDFEEALALKIGRVKEEAPPE